MKSFPLVKCPYCFEPIKYNEAVFRCTSGEKCVDEYLKTFNIENGNVSYEREDFGFVDPADLSVQQITIDSEKHITGVENPNLAMRLPLQQRLCPYCHNELLRSFGKKETRYIAVVGVPNSGKTTYLAAVNDSMRKKSWNWISLNSERSSPLDTVTDLYSANQNEAQTATEAIQGPYFYSLNYTGENTKKSMESHIVFFDVPGEFYSNADKITNSLANFLSEADGIIFIVNSAEEVEHQRAIKNGHFERLVRVNDVLEAFAQAGIAKNKKTAIIFNKLDLVEDEIGLNPHLAIFPKPTDKAINEQEIDSLSTDTINLILGDGAANPSPTQRALNGYMRKIQQVFGDDCRVFATRLIRESDSSDNYIFNSTGAETPFLWLLSKIGVFPTEHTN